MNPIPDLDWQGCCCVSQMIKPGLKPNEVTFMEEGERHFPEAGEALQSLTVWERAMHVSQLLGPFILLIERSPADLWLSVIALTFAGRSILLGEGWWLRFMGAPGISVLDSMPCFGGASSSLPAYSLGEIFVWFRFPLFAMAVAFWLGRDRRLVNAMLLSVGVGMLTMCLILASGVLLLV